MNFSIECFIIVKLFRDWRILNGSRPRHFIVGSPAAFQTFKPPAMERTFL